ncbi:MAG: MXAN_5187 C-terminal domain-containing protein [Chloracidobacterium sp.]|uniref:Uncharacterized protein n=1 Tax=Chloracidobacterium validum TaxID=2821543 RepID=A0ABX8B9F7_9BACT|nr:MXAN_5187 C-terminal domain-containing protein [Chloracidobacterium validum]QUW03513.1 hypothetical protein J8C06_03480 [Chloracidobacterium validum]
MSEPKSLDEQISLLDEEIRRLKIEFDMYFNGGRDRPPYDTKWRVEALIKKIEENRSLRFQQRFRFNQIVARFVAFRRLWDRTLKDREEGRDLRAQYLANFRESEEKRREEFGEAIDELDVDAVFGDFQRNPLPPRFEPTTVQIGRNTSQEQQESSIRKLYESLQQAKRTVGEATNTSYEQFRQIIVQNTQKLCSERNTTQVNFTVDIVDGKVKFKAK